MAESTLETTSGIDRRSLLKAAAWSVPVVAAASAAPLASASPEPACPQCFDEGTLGATAFVSAIAGNRGIVTIANVLGMDSSACDLTLFKPVYTSIITSATLKMSDGNTYTAPGLGSATGTFGEIGGLPSAFVFSDVYFPNGTYLLNSNPVRPESLTITANIALIGLPELIELTCPTTLTWDFDVWGVGAVFFGVGTVEFAGTATDGTP